MVGVFAGRAQAYQAINDLHHAGFRDEQVGFIAREELDETKNTQPTQPLHASEVETGAKPGAVAGGVVGGLAGAAVALLIPGLGPALAGGILATIGGAAVGAATGGVIGTLVEVGVPEEDAHRYNNDVHSGRIIVIVQADDNPIEAFRILKQDQALNPDASTVPTQEYDQEATVKLEAPEAKVLSIPTDDSISA